MSKHLKEVKVYTTEYCPYCDRAKKLLDRKQIDYKVIDLSSDPDELAKLKEKTGLKTVPQIFIGEELIGGFQELSLLESSGELDKKILFST
ncbi:MAG: glutaredoxin 3 [Bacteriovoracales bacterium]|nr:glutaredoxin 3 [Bacteriovoracales bacterium]